jgi:hypothetical protein
MREERDPVGGDVPTVAPPTNTYITPTADTFYLEGGDPFDPSSGYQIDGLPVSASEFQRRMGSEWVSLQALLGTWRGSFAIKYRSFAIKYRGLGSRPRAIEVTRSVIGTRRPWRPRWEMAGRGLEDCARHDRDGKAPVMKSLPFLSTASATTLLARLVAILDELFTLRKLGT